MREIVGRMCSRTASSSSSVRTSSAGDGRRETSWPVASKIVSFSLAVATALRIILKDEPDVVQTGNPVKNRE